MRMHFQRLIVRRSVEPETRIRVRRKRRGVLWEFSISESKVASRRARRLEQEDGTKSKGGKERGEPPKTCDIIMFRGRFPVKPFRSHTVTVAPSSRRLAFW